MSTSLVEEVNYYKQNAFEKQKGYGSKKFAFCKITHPTLPGSIEYSRNVLGTVLSRTYKMNEKDPRYLKLKTYIEEKNDTTPAVDIKHLMYSSVKTPSRLGYTIRLYDISTDVNTSGGASTSGTTSTSGTILRNIKDMYLKEDEIAVRTELGKYDIVDAISSVDAVDEYKQVFDRIQNKDQKNITRQVENGFFRELSCYLAPDYNTEISFKDFNKLMDIKDETTGHNIHGLDSFVFTYKGTRKPYNGVYTVDTVIVGDDVENATYTFRTYDPKLEQEDE